ncbi:MAG: hypothetical protein K6B46_02065 [Opitutales bacterium]|nr:hypothetical protein [Opitutales bacterium]
MTCPFSAYDSSFMRPCFEKSALAPCLHPVDEKAHNLVKGAACASRYAEN